MHTSVLRFYLALMKYARWERKLCRCPRCLTDEREARARALLIALVAVTVALVVGLGYILAN